MSQGQSKALVIGADRLQSRYPERGKQARPDELVNIDAITAAHWQIHRHHRSAWRDEFGLRPCVLRVRFDRVSNSIAGRSKT